MLKIFKAYIEKEKLFCPNDKILLAVSGGVDSVVMSELFYKAGFSFGIAHCNFGLRGDESDGDEEFVKTLAGRYNVPFYSTRFSTRKDASNKGISIQMSARELRYSWFEAIRKNEHYSFIATAHHLDDQVETFFINLLRSTGIAGLHGILPKQGFIIRPMLFTDRNGIVAFALKHKLDYREDSSNADNKYLRNKLRHEIAPILQELNPAFPQTLNETIHRLRETETIFRTSIEETRNKIVRSEKGISKIRIAKLKELTPVDIFAFELLSPFGFHESVIRNILNSQEENSGKVFYSSTHRLICNRENLIIEPLPTEKERKPKDFIISIPENKREIRMPIHLMFTKTFVDKNFTIDLSKEIANLDLRKITFPLILRRWVKGDTFHPFGMDNKKKLSDFFIDVKLSIPEKENIWLLCSGSNILWIVGQRIDHRFRITSHTKEVLQVSWIVKNS